MLKYVLEFRETGSRKAHKLTYGSAGDRDAALNFILSGREPKDDLTIRVYTEPADAPEVAIPVAHRSTPAASAKARGLATPDFPRGLTEAERRMLERGETPPRFEEILSVED